MQYRSQVVDFILYKNGEDGQNGLTPYIHIKYSNDCGTSFTQNSGETPGDYLGVYADFTETDSLDISKYKWSKIKGEQGIQGIQGPQGPNGEATYFHVKYSPVANPTASQMTEIPDAYIGTYVDASQADSTDPSKYTWYKIKGEDGQSIKGDDGKTYYWHIRYSNDGGTTFTANNGETPGDYLGQCVSETETDPTDPSKYTWVKIKGEDGTGIDIKGSYKTEAELNAAHPTGNTGDSYLVSGNLYVWSGSKWEDVGNIQGPQGETGRSVESIIPEYYVSTSKETQENGEWSKTTPTWRTGTYLWIRNEITYRYSSYEGYTPSEGTSTKLGSPTIFIGDTVYTEPYCDSSWEAVNEIQVGGRNLIRNSKNMVYEDYGFFVMPSTNYKNYVKSFDTVSPLGVTEECAKFSVEHFNKKKSTHTYDRFGAFRLPITEVGKEYTFSGWIKSTNGNPNLLLGTRNLENVTLHSSIVTDTFEQYVEGENTYATLYISETDTEIIDAFQWNNAITANPGDIYTFSFYGYGTDAETVDYIISLVDGNNSSGDTNDYVKVVRTYSTCEQYTVDETTGTITISDPDDTNKHYRKDVTWVLGETGNSVSKSIRIQIKPKGIDESIIFELPKLEEGPDVTIWTPAPEDGETDNTVRNVDINGTVFETSEEWTKCETTFTATDTRFKITFLAPGLYYLYRSQLELGNKATDWTPSPEDVDTGINNAQNAADNAQNAANDALNQVGEAKLAIDSINRCISMLVTSKDGDSLMTQTPDGWTFSLGDLQDSIDNLENDINGNSGLKKTYEEMLKSIVSLQNLTDNHRETLEYVHIGTWGDQPCIELGESDSDKKLLITNDRIIFKRGANNDGTYIDDDGFNTDNITVNNEIKQGGWTWVTHGSGNLGLVWKGVS